MSISEMFAIASVLLTSGGLIAMVRSTNYEVQRLRDWRHRIGDDPALPVLQIVKLLEERVSRLERQQDKHDDQRTG